MRINKGSVLHTNVDNAGNKSFQTLGTNSVHVGYWYDKNNNKYKRVTGKGVNKLYLFKDGKWEEVK